jgi:DNA/RNA-binding domain of Phe-tRNA-synthetase-like protein
MANFGFIILFLSELISRGTLMPSFDYSISPDIFRKYPGYVRGVLLAFDVLNAPSSPALIELLRAAEESLRSRLDLNTLAEHPAFKSWREAFRAFGAKPADFRPSIEGLARRVLRGDPLPSINTLVDIGNIISLRNLLPAGAHAVDRLEADIALRLADGSEDFIALGSDQLEHPLPGEVIFAEGNTVLTRRWVWRQGSRTLTLPESTAVEYNVDGLPPAPLSAIEEACAETAGLVSRFCGGRLRWEILSQDHPHLQITP